MLKLLGDGMPQARYGMKICSNCEFDKEITEYYASKATKDKLQSQCKACANHASNESHGMKRAAKAELKDLLSKGALGFELAKGELKTQYRKKLEVLCAQYHKDVGKALSGFNLE